jgi:arylsulfatase A-like enzyme
LAAKMQASVPGAINFDGETEETKRLYGLDDPVTAAAGRNYLLARRLIERGVRFVQVYNGAALGGNPRINWDAHEDVKTNHDAQGVLLDKPCAGLLKDLKRRGLLDDPLVFWSSEFGRTPFTEGENGKGRDHHPLVFTCWMAGAGLKKGVRHGASDDVGYQPAEHPVTVYDFHATILHLLGLDHTRLTFYHNGIQRRLTDVHGRVIEEILA